MSKFLGLLAQYIGLPLLEKLGKWIFSFIKDYLDKKRIIKEQKAKEKAIEDAKTPEQIRTAHRNNKL